VAGVQHGVSGKACQYLKAVVHGRGVASGKVGASAPVEEQGVTRHQASLDEEALAPRGVPRRVYQGDLDAAHGHDVAGFVKGEITRTQTRRATDPGRLVTLHVDLCRSPFEQARHTLDAVTHHRSPHMVRVVVRRQDMGDAQAVGLHQIHQFVDGVGGIDECAFAGGPVADGVGEVDHLGGQGIAYGEVTARQPLPEVQRGLHPLSVRLPSLGAMNPTTPPASGEPLDHLVAGMPLLVGGDRVVRVSERLATAFRPGDRLVVVHDSGEVLHLPSAEIAAVDAVLSPAVDAFVDLGTVADAQIDRCFGMMADLLERSEVFDHLVRTNAADVESARRRGRSTTRLVLDDRMRGAMVAGLRMWADLRIERDALVDTVQHVGWRVETRRAPLGVVGFVFEGRPNVLVDAAGVLRSGNTAVLRIGSDALGTARALMERVIRPALVESGLPVGSIGLVDATSHASGWALFCDRRLGLAVARGSGPAVAQLGAVARQVGTPVSLHGTGGAWLVAGEHAEADWLGRVVRRSLDRKVCNTLNVCCVVASRAAELVPVVLDGLRAAATDRGARPRLHVVGGAGSVWAGADVIDETDLAREWEWEDDPEMSLVVVDDLDHAIDLCNRYSPRFVASLVSVDPREQDRFWSRIDAPFVGNGFTRWVDGQYALGRPELGLSNWEGGRLFGRGGVLSGDSVHTVRLRVVQSDPDLHR